MEARLWRLPNGSLCVTPLRCTAEICVTDPGQTIYLAGSGPNLIGCKEEEGGRDRSLSESWGSFSLQCAYRQIEEGRFSNEIALVLQAIVATGTLRSP